VVKAQGEEVLGLDDPKVGEWPFLYAVWDGSMVFYLVGRNHPAMLVYKADPSSVVACEELAKVMLDYVSKRMLSSSLATHIVLEGAARGAAKQAVAGDERDARAAASGDAVRSDVLTHQLARLCRDRGVSFTVSPGQSDHQMVVDCDRLDGVCVCMDGDLVAAGAPVFSPTYGVTALFRPSVLWGPRPPSPFDVLWPPPAAPAASTIRRSSRARAPTPRAAASRRARADGDNSDVVDLSGLGKVYGRVVLLWLAVLAGCDYTDGVRGAGPVTVQDVLLDAHGQDAALSVAAVHRALGRHARLGKARQRQSDEVAVEEVAGRGAELDEEAASDEGEVAPEEGMGAVEDEEMASRHVTFESLDVFEVSVARVIAALECGVVYDPTAAVSVRRNLCEVPERFVESHALAVAARDEAVVGVLGVAVPPREQGAAGGAGGADDGDGADRGRLVDLAACGHRQPASAEAWEFVAGGGSGDHEDGAAAASVIVVPNCPGVPLIAGTMLPVVYVPGAFPSEPSAVVMAGPMRQERAARLTRDAATHALLGCEGNEAKRRRLRSANAALVSAEAALERARKRVRLAYRGAAREERGLCTVSLRRDLDMWHTPVERDPADDKEWDRALVARLAAMSDDVLLASNVFVLRLPETLNGASLRAAFAPRADALTLLSSLSVADKRAALERQYAMEADMVELDAVDLQFRDVSPKSVQRELIERGVLLHAITTSDDDETVAEILGRAKGTLANAEGCERVTGFAQLQWRMPVLTKAVLAAAIGGNARERASKGMNRALVTLPGRHVSSLVSLRLADGDGVTVCGHGPAKDEADVIFYMTVASSAKDTEYEVCGVAALEKPHPEAAAEYPGTIKKFRMLRCSCTSGRSERCSHVICLLYMVAYIQRAASFSVHDGMCTDYACAWNDMAYSRKSVKGLSGTPVRGLDSVVAQVGRTKKLRGHTSDGEHLGAAGCDPKMPQKVRTDRSKKDPIGKKGRDAHRVADLAREGRGLPPRGAPRSRNGGAECIPLEDDEVIIRVKQLYVRLYRVIELRDKKRQALRMSKGSIGCSAEYGMRYGVHHEDLTQMAEKNAPPAYGTYDTMPVPDDLPPSEAVRSGGFTASTASSTFGAGAVAPGGWAHVPPAADAGDAAAAAVEAAGSDEFATAAQISAARAAKQRSRDSLKRAREVASAAAASLSREMDRLDALRAELKMCSGRLAKKTKKLPASSGVREVTDAEYLRLGRILSKVRDRLGKFDREGSRLWKELASKEAGIEGGRKHVKKWLTRRKKIEDAVAEAVKRVAACAEKDRESADEQKKAERRVRDMRDLVRQFERQDPATYLGNVVGLLSAALESIRTPQMRPPARVGGNGDVAAGRDRPARPQALVGDFDEVAADNDH